MVSRTKESASYVTSDLTYLVPRFPLIAEQINLPKDTF